MFGIINRNTRISARCIVQRYLSSTSTSSTKETVDIKDVDEKPLFDDEKYSEEELLKIRNKSRLNPQHRNILMDQKPYEQEMIWIHQTTKYKKRMIGRYGLNSLKVKPGICWPSKEEVEYAKEYERVAYPWELKEAWKMIEQKNKEEKEKIKARDEEIDKNMKKNEKWQQDLIQRLQKKEAEILEAKKRRERMLQEVRDHFGFKIDTHDERFKELLEQKEKEEKKARKAAKKEEKMKQYLEKLTQIDQAKVKKVKEETNKESADNKGAENEVKEKS